ncbi:acyltransferase family protein [Pontibacter mangrovi]|uniref:Acyltransferase n=1 Tax=Pontibacter mangrovi TaxID=2589816 RepID=A0A501W2U6_9BACT|nr:acyltransferase family protein [Pontibacter mangrovi]TPE42404.1 acyltransferase [Pontibacter mangrovi]
MMPERRYDIDWLRVIAIGLLLIYHIAIVFQPWAMFIGFVKSDELMPDLWTPMTMLNVWRIPLLFFVSGMGVYFATRKRNWRALLLERAKRILVPFLFGMVAISPLHIFLFQRYYHMPLQYMAHPSHLWFLGNIFVYVLLLSPLFFYLKKEAGGRFMKSLSAVLGNPFGPLLITVFFVLEALLLKPAIFEMYVQTWHGFFLGLLAFFFGFLFVYSGKPFWQTVLKWRWLYLALAVSLYAIRFLVLNLNAPGYLMAVESNCWILAVFGFGYKHLNKPGAALSYLSQAAYPVYIIHMFVLYAGATLILPLELPVVLKFVTIVAFTAAGCYLLYEFVIRRVSFLGPLFGLKWTYKKKAKAKVAAEDMVLKSLCDDSQKGGLNSAGMHP